MRADPLNSRCRRPISMTTPAEFITTRRTWPTIEAATTSAGSTTTPVSVSQRDPTSRGSGGRGDVPVAAANRWDSKVAWSMMMLTTGSGGCAPMGAGHGGLEDGVESIGAALTVGALEHRRAGVVADPSSQLVPFGVELGVFETTQDLSNRRALGGAELGGEMERVVQQRRGHPPTGVGGVVASVGTVGVVEGFPAAGHQPKLGIRQVLGVLDQHGGGPSQ